MYTRLLRLRFGGAVITPYVGRELFKIRIECFRKCDLGAYNLTCDKVHDLRLRILMAPSDVLQPNS